MRLRSLSGPRRWLAIGLRCGILLCLAAALAGTELVKKSDRLAVFFLLDKSNSVPEALRLAAAQSIRQSAEQYMTPKDDAGIIVFGEEARIELAMGPNLAMGDVRSFVGGEQTDVAAAIRLAMAAFPQGSAKRIVLYCDGNETRGTAIEEIKLARAAGIAVDVVPLEISAPTEVRLREVTAPGRANASEPFQIRALVNAQQDCAATLRLFQNGDGGRTLLAEQQVTLQKGDNSFVLPQTLAAPGFYEYAATIESGADTVPQNNENQAYTIIQGEPRILYVDAEPEQSLWLGPALQKEGVNVTQAKVGELSFSLAQLQNYDALVLANVDAVDLSVDQMRSIEAMVRDLGIGLVMIGGPDTFGAGGYQNTPVEKALPISMDIKQRKLLPRGALVLILHTCEINDGNAWARDIGLAALDVLSSRDLMGALVFTGREEWLYELQPVGDKSIMKNALLHATPGDMPDVGTTLSVAGQSLTQASAAVKRVVIISDGDPAAPPASLLKQLNEAKISVSTICIAPHSNSDQNMLRWVAETTGGNYYFVQDPNRLPQIFTKEASVVKRGRYVEEPFKPQVLHDSELLQGVNQAGLPQLNGYVVTTPKDTATIPIISHEKDPILAHWRYGLGKSVAFTSDVTSRWAPDWVTWSGFNRFWAQSVRWAMREVASSSFRIETRAKDGMGHVRIDAVDDQGKFVNFLRPQGVVTTPAPAFTRRELAITQTAPGIYEGTFPLDNSGVYMLNLTYERPDGSRGYLPAGLALGYSPEYERNTTNAALLAEFADTGGGLLRAPGDNPFAHDLPTSATITPMWRPLVLAAALAFPVEIFVRRVVVDFSIIYTALLMALRRLPGFSRWLRPPVRKRAPATGAYGAGVESQGRIYAPVPPGAAGRPGASDALAGADAAIPGGLTLAQKANDDDVPQQQEQSPKPPAVQPEYTRQLLAAKERAAQKLEKKARRDQDKPNE